MKLGITQCCMWNSKVADFIPAAGKAGYEMVELLIRDQGDVHPGMSPAEIEAVLQLAKKSGVEIFSLCHTHLKNKPVEGGEANQKCVEQIEAGLRLARAMGVKNTLITLGWLNAELYYDDAYANAVRALRRAGKTAQELGVDIAVEFMWNGFLFSPLEMKRFLEEIDNPRVGFYFDPGNMAVFQFPQHWVRILGKHIQLVHVKDWEGHALKGGWTALLEGRVDFVAVMRELRAIGYDGPLTSEVDPAMASFEKTAEAIRKIRVM